MSEYVIHVNVEEPFEGQVPPDLLEVAARAALDQARTVWTEEEWTTGQVLEMTVVVTADAHIQSLNRDFLGNDAPTDVLSFPAEGEVEPRTLPVESAHWPEDSPMEAVLPAYDWVEDEDAAEMGANTYLGDVILSYPRAQEQAGGHHSVADELQLLTVHGTLHLLGYDHATPEEQAEMWAVQTAALRAIGASLTEPLDA